MTKPTFQMSADARLLMQHLDKLAVGETADYATLSAVISRDVRKNFGALGTARHRLLRDAQKAFATVRKVGIKRLADNEIVAEGKSYAESIRRKARQSIERQMVVSFDKLSAPEQRAFTAQVSIMGAIAMMSSQRGLDRIGAAATPERRELPVAETLTLFAQ
jgi:hypothetical protein